MLLIASSSAFAVAFTFIATCRSEMTPLASSTVRMMTAAMSGGGALPVRRSVGSGLKFSFLVIGARGPEVPVLTS
jgi:hypothetical protein